MTANELITPALRMIGVLQETESASAEQASTALVTLNDMMAGLASEGVDLGYAPQSDPNVDVGLNIEDRQAIKALLAAALCPDYERLPHPVVSYQAMEGRNKLLREAFLRNPIPRTETLHSGDNQTLGGFNILTGQ